MTDCKFQTNGLEKKISSNGLHNAKLESTAKQVSNRFYKYQNALQKKSLKIPKVCYDSEALILECGVYLDPPKYAMIKMHQFGIVVFMDMWILYGCHAGTRMGRRSTASSSGIETARLVVYKLETLLSFLILEYG